MPSQYRELPLFPLNAILFPGMTLPLRIFEPRYLQMIDDCMNGDPLFGVVLIKEGAEVGGPAVPYDVGTTARIIGLERKGEGKLHITAVGEERFFIRDLRQDRPYLVGMLEPFPMEGTDAPEVPVLVDTETALLSVYLELLSRANGLEIRLQHAPDDPETLAHIVAMLLQVPLPVKQRLLATAHLSTLLHKEMALLEGEISGLTIRLRGEDILEQTSAHLFSTN